MSSRDSDNGNSNQTNDNNKNDLIFDQTLPSFLSKNCSVPTELFNTLSPISSTQITSQSTPFVTTNTKQSRNELRNRSYSASGTTGLKDLGLESSVGFGKNSFLAQKLQTKQMTQRDSAAAGTQTLKSFLAEQSVQHRETSSSGHSSTQSSKRESGSNSMPSLGSENQRRFEPIGNEYDGNDFNAQKSHSSSIESSVSHSDLPLHQAIDHSSRERALQKQTFVKSIPVSNVQTLPVFKSEQLLLRKSGSSSSDNSSSIVSKNSLRSQQIFNMYRNQSRDELLEPKLVEQTYNALKSAAGSASVTTPLGLQTIINYGISSLLREKMQRKYVSRKKKETVSSGTQTMRSYLAKESIKQKHMSSSVNREKSSDNGNTTSASTASEVYKSRNHTNKNTNSNIHNDIRLTTQSFSHLVIKNKKELIKNREEYCFPETDNKQPIAWFIPINKSQRNASSRVTKKRLYTGHRNRQLSRDHSIQDSNSQTLQEAFNMNCIKMKIQSQQRINRINTIAELRKHTAEERLLGITESYERHKENARLDRTIFIQPIYNPCIKRFFTHKEMREQTEKIYRNLPEVKAMKDKKKREERERNQRLMAQIYKYRLKDNALKGKVTWKITQSCISY